MANSKVADIAAVRKKKAAQQREYRLRGGDARRKKEADYAREYWHHGKGFVLEGVTFVCVDCDKEFPKIDVKQKRCSDCRITFMREHNRARRLRVGHVPIGTLQKCKNCPTEFKKEFKRQFYCAPCSKMSEVGTLPHQIEATRKRYATFRREQRRKYSKWSISARMSAGIRNSLKDGKDGRSWESLVGYAVSDLMQHIERRFLSGMTWKNRGKWHIDHQRPLASFTFQTSDDPDFKLAWALKNLQPLWAVDNMRKGAKLNYKVAA